MIASSVHAKPDELAGPGLGPENQSKISAYLSSVIEEIESIDGLIRITLISVSESETLGLSYYESEEKMVRATEVQQRVLAGVAELLDGAPEIDDGDIYWEWSR